jgi:hypothetical protein
LFDKLWLFDRNHELCDRPFSVFFLAAAAVLRGKLAFLTVAPAVLVVLA